MSVPAMQATDPVRETSHVPPPYDLIELLFFAYRDFVGSAMVRPGSRSTKCRTR